MYSIYHNLKIGDSKCWKLSDNMKLVNGYKKRYGTMHIDIFSYEKKILIQKVWKCVGNTADYWCLKNVQVTIMNDEKWPVTYRKWWCHLAKWPRSQSSMLFFATAVTWPSGYHLAQVTEKWPVTWQVVHHKNRLTDEVRCCSFKRSHSLRSLP